MFGRKAILGFTATLAVMVSAPCRAATLEEYKTRFGETCGYWHDTPGITRILFKPEPDVTCILDVDAETLEPVGEEVYGIGGPFPAKYRLQVDTRGARRWQDCSNANHRLWGCYVFYALKDGGVVMVRGDGCKATWEYPGYKRHLKPQ